MPQVTKRKKMTEDEFWEYIDWELGHVFVGVTAAHLVIPMALATTALTAWLFLN